jgi:tetratricopeptide (TPR) repeat protein
MTRTRGAAAWARVAAPALVAGVTLVCFAPALPGGFLNWDDDVNLTANPRYRGLGWSHLGWMLTTFHAGHWHPLTWLTLAVDHAVWGMNPFGYHLTNVLLHATSAALFTVVVGTLLATRVPGLAPTVPALLGGLFFAIHPLRVESVAWLSERRDVLSGVFYLTTLLAYLRMHATRGAAARGVWYAASIVACLLSLLSKAWAVTLPVVLLVLDAYPLGRFGSDVPARRRLAVLLEKLPYALLALPAAVLAGRAARPLTSTLEEHGVLARLAQAAYGLVFYLWKTLAPWPLAPLYALDPPLDLASPRWAACAVAVLGISAALVVRRRRWPWALAAWSCYAVIVSPVLGFVQMGPQLAADRYTYLACLPWAVLLAAAVVPPDARRRVAAALVVGGLGLLTFRQAHVWQSSLALWDHAVRVDPDHAIAHLNRGWARQASGDLDGAIADFSRAIELKPAFGNAYFNRGTAWKAKGDLAAAIADYSQAIRLEPTVAGPYNNRANARLQQGDIEGAIADYTEAIRLDPRFARAYENRAIARRVRGDLAGAADDRARAMALGAATAR